MAVVKLTKQSFEKLASSNVPANILEYMKPIANKDFPDEGALMTAVTKIFGPQNAEKLKPLLLQAVERAQPAGEEEVLGDHGATEEINHGYVLQDILEYMVNNDASDVYLTYEAPPMYRIEGITKPNGTDKNLSMQDCEDLCNQAMNKKQQLEFEDSYECNLALYYPKLGRFRVNVFRQRNAPGMVIRQIRVKIMTTEELQLPAILNDIVMAKRGLIIVVGATGSGKSTSLAAMIDYRNRHSPGHIITIEDPVEFVHPHKKCVITQREVGTDTVSFKAALKNTLRQAPDVILLGEIRDAETMEHAVEFAETGHLSIGTLHANNANQAIERVMNFFPIEKHEQVYMQLSLNLRAIISQRLPRTVDGKRRAAVEILINKPRIADLIKKGEVDSIKEAMEQLTTDGLQTFDQALFNLYRDEIISYEEALVNSDSANNLRLKIKTAGLSIPGEEDATDGFAFQESEPVEPQMGAAGRRPNMKKR